MSLLLVPLLRHTVALQRKTTARDATGGGVATWATVSGSGELACLVQGRTGKAPRMLGQKQVLVTHVIYFSADPEWVRGDRFLWSEGSLVLQVHGVEDMGGQGRVWRAETTLESA